MPNVAGARRDNLTVGASLDFSYNSSVCDDSKRAASQESDQHAHRIRLG
jgi:hypothetical protein